MAGLRQYRRQFARRKPVIERGLTMPSLFRFDGDLDRRLVADWVSSPMAALWHSNSKNLGLADWPLSGNRMADLGTLLPDSLKT